MVLPPVPFRYGRFLFPLIDDRPKDTTVGTIFNLGLAALRLFHKRFAVAVAALAGIQRTAAVRASSVHCSSSFLFTRTGSAQVR